MMGQSTTVSFLRVAMIVAVFSTPIANSQVLRFGNCPNPTPTAQNLPDSTYLTGVPVWYVAQRTKSFFGLKPYCETFTFTIPTGNPPLTIDISGNFPPFKSIHVYGEMTSTDFKRWSVTFRRTALSAILLPTTLATQYIVLGIDSVTNPTWVVLYSCTQTGSTYLETVYILSSTKFMDSTRLGAAKAILTGAGITNTLSDAEQTVCIT